MKTIYYYQHCGDDCGEVEGIFDEKGDSIGTWCSNDANWRNEYYAPFMKSLGFNVKKLPKSLEQKAIEALEAKFGI